VLCLLNIHTVKERLIHILININIYVYSMLLNILFLLMFLRLRNTHRKTYANNIVLKVDMFTL